MTNRHVAQDLSNGVVRINSQGSAPPRGFSLPTAPEFGEPIWTYHPDPDVDVAVTPVSIDFMAPENSEVALFAGDHHTLTSAQMKAQEMQEGDSVFLLGFPMGLVGSERNTVIVRGGHIARIRDLLNGANKTLLVDSWVFPGNSGGPVVSRPEFTSIEGTQTHAKADLIGIVSRYLTYRDIAVSQQTQQPTVVFEENAGLTVVFPVECIQAVIAVFEAAHPLPTADVPEPEIVEFEEDDPIRDVPPRCPHKPKELFLRGLDDDSAILKNVHPPVQSCLRRSQRLLSMPELLLRVP